MVVTLANGTALTADYVIVTAPLGVLKEGTIQFSPPLPAAKQEAIKNMVRTISTQAALSAMQAVPSGCPRQDNVV